MDLYEYQGKQLFKKFGIPVSDGQLVAAASEALRAAQELGGGPVVVKAQVLIGGRGKAGGVKLAFDETQAREHASKILGMDIRGRRVATLWIERASDIASEYYASVLLDRQVSQPLVIFSVEGGVDIEQVAEQSPEKLIRHHVDSLEGLSRREAVEIATAAGVDASESDSRSKARSRADWNRCSGSFSRQWRTMRSRPGGIWRLVAERSGGSSFRIALIVSADVSP